MWRDEDRRTGGGLVGVVALSLMLGGCSGSMFSADAGWFARKPVLFETQTWGALGTDTKAHKRRPVTPADLVDASGACAAPVEAEPPPVAAAPAAQPAPVAAARPDGAPLQLGAAVASAAPTAPGAPADPAAPAAAPLVPGGIALEMTECQVVHRAGHPERVDIGTGPDNARTVVLTYINGPRPGIYHFVDGRLRVVDRAPTPPAPPRTKPRRHRRRA